MYFAVAIKTDGTIWAWGDNSFGQLGDGTTTNKSIPIQIGVATNWKSVDAGKAHVIATKTDGTLWTWGWNGYGQLGDGTSIDKNSPIQIGSATNWQSVSGGAWYSLAVKTVGTLWTWGDNSSGQLGDGPNTGKNAPVRLGMATNWQTISGGNGCTLSIKTEGNLWAWGANYNGELGDGTGINKNVPTFIASPQCITDTKEINYDKNHFSLFPNPVHDFLYLENETNLLFDKIIISDMLGRKILEKNENSNQINLQELKPGMYQLLLYSDGEVYQNKFIKE
jgi:alpha-tubulin suppressor-like RCC1 family protein